MTIICFFLAHANTFWMVLQREQFPAVQHYLFVYLFITFFSIFCLKSIHVSYNQMVLIFLQLQLVTRTENKATEITNFFV